MKKQNRKMAMLIMTIIIFSCMIAVGYTHRVDAKKDNNVKMAAAETMAKYSMKGKVKQNQIVRRSRLTKINVLGETAQILNMLPIHIIEEMKNGKTLVDIAKKKGFSEGQFLQQLTVLDTKIINDSLNNGTISEKHANALLEGQKERLHHNVMMTSMDVNDHKAMDMNH